FNILRSVDPGMGVKIKIVPKVAFVRRRDDAVMLRSDGSIDKVSHHMQLGEGTALVFEPTQSIHSPDRHDASRPINPWFRDHYTRIMDDYISRLDRKLSTRVDSDVYRRSNVVYEGI